MTYITVMQSPKYHQVTLDEFLFGDPKPALVSLCQACTRTYTTERPNERLLSSINVNFLIHLLEAFNIEYKHIMDVEDRHSLYSTFYIPKKTHGFRKIDAPCDDLSNAIRNLKDIFENQFHALYHTSAFAYVKKRCTIDAVKRHQENQSRWFAKYDFSNFFGSTTKEFVVSMFEKIFPFSEVLKVEKGRHEFEKAIDIAFLDGVLPQGTPISPLITNIMMIPVDFELSNKFKKFNNNKMVYTRYADDILVSSRYDFDFRQVESEINNVLEKFNAPFKIKNEKTRYGSSAGANWNLGVMLNKDNEITVGHKRLRQFKASCTSFVLDTLNGNLWEKEDVMVLEGLRNYYSMVEEDTIKRIVEGINAKNNVNIRDMIKSYLKP